MPISSDFTIDYTDKKVTHVGGQTTVWTVRNLYTYLQDTFDDSDQINDSLPMSAQTPNEFTLINAWFMDDASMQFLKSGAIQTNGHLNAIQIVTLQASGYTNAVAGDIGKMVTDDGGNTGNLLNYDNANRKWWVRWTTTIATGSVMAIISGTGTGTSTGASLTGENIWSNIFSLGTLVSGTTLDVYQNDTQITPWWSSGQIDVLVKVKEAGTEIDTGNLTVLARKYSTLYDHYVIDASTGRNPVPLAAFTDTNNQTAEGTVGAYTGITITFGYVSYDLGNGNGARPYDVEINCGNHTILEVYEYLKYVTRTGSGSTLNGVNGEYYQAVGDIRFTYTPGGGTFAQGDAITDTTSNATGYITSRDSGTNTLVIRNTHGAFTNGDSITNGTATGTINSVPDSITQSKQAPFGTFAGGKFFGARGVWITNYAGSDGNNFSLIDSTGTAQNPPSTISITVNSVVSGDRVSVFRTTGDNEIIDKSVYTSHNTANTSGLGTFTVTTTIAADTPSTGNLRVVNRNASGNIIDEQSYVYTSWNGTVFTLSGTLSQTYNSDDTAYIPYIDVTASSTSASVSITYAADRYIVTRVRKKGIVPFAVKGQLTNANLTVTAIRTSDSIVT